MKLSIITINYNNVEGLRKTIASVAAQTYRDIEHIIVDAASIDGSVDIIKDYARACRYPVVWSSEPDGGVYAGMNKGIKKATGEYIYILNSGDKLAGPEVTARMIAALNDGMSRDKSLNDGGMDILIGNIVQVYADGKRKVERRESRVKGQEPQPIESSMLTFYKGTIPQDAAFVRRELFEKYGYFDEKMKICADWKLYLNMITLGGVQPWYVDIDVVQFDMSGISNTNNELRLAERRAYLEEVLPASVLKDYDDHAFDIEQMNRLRERHLYRLVYFIERVLFKLEKWGILR